MLSDRMATRHGSAPCGLPPRREPLVIPMVPWRKVGEEGWRECMLHTPFSPLTASISQGCC